MSKGVIPCTLLSQQRTASHGAFASNLCWRPLLAGSHYKRHSWERGSSLFSSACSGFFLHSEDVDMAVSVQTPARPRVPWLCWSNRTPCASESHSGQAPSYQCRPYCRLTVLCARRHACPGQPPEATSSSNPSVLLCPVHVFQ